MNTLRDKINDIRSPVIFYELLPPTCDESANISAYVQCAIELLTSSPIKIDAINIPDIRDEANYPNVSSPKIDAHAFATILEKASYQNINLVLNRATVYETMDAQVRWIDDIVQQRKHNTIILVGGSSSKIDYPGPSVLTLGSHIKNNYQQEALFCGGITIQSRRSSNLARDEPNHLIIKAQHGIEFFTSQIIYDADCIKSLLRDYARACEQEGVQPKRIFLSFAPIANHKDLTFIRWLGALVPKEVENELFKATIGVGWRSVEVAAQILEDILRYRQLEKIQIPLGLNIEYITRHNFELSLQFVERLGSLYHDHGLKF